MIKIVINEITGMSHKQVIHGVLLFCHVNRISLIEVFLLTLHLLELKFGLVFTSTVEWDTKYQFRICLWDGLASHNFL